MSRGRRTVTRSTNDPKLTPLQDAIESAVTVDPALATEIRAHSMGTRDEARKTRGSIDGNGGPRMMMLSGYETPGDGGEGVFYWDPTSTTADDEGVATLAPLDAGVGRWKRAQLYPDPVPQHDALLGVTTYTSGSGTFTPSALTSTIRVRLWAGGGGGGGAFGTGAGNVDCGGGGSAGGFAEVWYTTIPASFTYAAGAGGTAGAAAGGAGGNGGNSTFNNGTTTVTANGGNGGAGDGSGAAAAHVLNGGDPATVSTNGTINGTSQPGGHAVHLTATSAHSGCGGSTSITGGAPSRFASGAGTDGGVGGGGGSGGLDKGTSTNRAGGAGGAGTIIVEEFG